MKIKISNLFSLMLMAASMFLFLGGCQREEVIQETKISKSIHTKGYNPVFDTIPKILNGRNALDSLPFQAPTTLQLRQLSENLKTIKSNHNVAQKAVSLKKSGSILSSNYAIITKEISTEDVYYITIPFIKDKVVTAILFYVEFGDNQFLTNIYTKADIETNMLSTAVPSNDFYIYYNLVNSLSNYQWIIENTVDKVKVDWLRENARIASRRPSGRCIEYEITVPTVVSMVYSPTNPNSPAPYYTWGTTTMVVPCAQEHNGYIGPGAVWPTGGSGSNNPNIQSGSDSVLVEKLLALDADCLRLLQNDMKNELLNSISPCNQDLLNSQITQAFNKACAEAKQNGGDNFLQNVEMWEFTESVREALEGVDRIIIDPNTCKNVSCITSKLMNHMQGKTNSPFFGFLCNDSNLSYTISSGSINQGSGVASIKGITLETSLFCGQNADPVELAETILHESIHTAFYAMDYFTKNKIPTDPNVLYFYNILKAPQPNGFGGNHHEFMAWHVTETAQILKDMNGGVGQVSDYYGLIWNGLSQGAGVDPVTQNLYNLYIDATMNLQGNNPNNLNQKDWISGQLDIYNIRIKPNNVLKFDCK